jgi:DNA-binding MarR family transcriptional regulator
MRRRSAVSDDLGFLLEAFVNKVSHPRGRALSFMSAASVTVPQVILMNVAMTVPNSTPSSLATAMNLSLSSVSQMIERLVKLGFLRRSEDVEDRRRKTISATPKAESFLDDLKALRAEEFAAGTEMLTEETRDLLKSAIARALAELEFRHPSSNGERDLRSKVKRA